MSTSLGTTSALTQLAKLIRGLPDMKRVYVDTETGDGGIPDQINQYPSAVIMGPRSGTVTRGPGSVQVHEYTVELTVFVAPEAAITASIYPEVLEWVGRITDLLNGNISLGGRITTLAAARQYTMQTLTYGNGPPCSGFQLPIEMREDAYVEFSVGVY